MGRARDLGEALPNDSADTAPPDPLIGRAQQDYSIFVEPDTSKGSGRGRRARTRSASSNSKAKADDDDFTYTTLDLRATKIADSSDLPDTNKSMLSSLISVIGTRATLLTTARYSGFNRPDQGTGIIRVGPQRFWWDAQSKDASGNAGIFRPEAFFPVKISVEGGVNGDENSTATYTYEMRDIVTDQVLGNGFTPLIPIPFGKLILPIPAIGVAFYLPTGFIKLWDAGERLDTEACP